MELEQIVVLKLNDKLKNPVLPKELESDTVKRIGSEFKRGTRDCIRGLNPVEERVHLPSLIGVSADSIEFNRKVQDFWADFSITPTKEGIRLNIAVEEVEVTDKEGNKMTVNRPVNLQDYMIYNFAKQSSAVATNKADQESGMYPFYLVNLAEEEKRKRASYQGRKDALTNFARLTSEKADPNKIDQVIRNLKEIDEAFNFDSPREVKEMYLEDKMQKDPVRFNEVVTDKDLEVKALLFKAIEMKEIITEGRYLFIGEENIGTEKETIEWLKSANNSAKVLALKARIDNIDDIKK